MTWLLPAGSASSGRADVLVTPEGAGWTYSGMHVYTLRPDEPVTVSLSGEEGVLISLSASDFQVDVNGTSVPMRGREGVFAAVSDWIYLPVDADVTITGNSGEVAICTARASKAFPMYYGQASSVPVEVRGAGQSTRQVTNYATPDSFHDAHKINVCEVITPGGNWSSWPPHRHDGIGDCTTTNEEIYYFRIGRGDSLHGDPSGQGLFHVYTVDGSHDETLTIHDADITLVPEGYHGPTVAPPEYPMYFLNVLAGPDEDRSMAFCDDPEHHWIRESWSTQQPDERLPMTSADGRVR